jgi:HAMP domain-containing protein
MKAHLKITALAGFSLLLIIIIAGFFLRNVMRANSALVAESAQTSTEIRQVEALAHELAILSTNIHQLISGKDNKFRAACQASRTAVHNIIDNLLAQDSDPADRSFPALLHGSFGSVEASLDKLLSLKDPAGRDQESARKLLIETVRLVAFMDADIGAFRKSKIDARAGQIADRARALQTNIVLFAVMTLLIAMVLLLGFAHFLRLAISIPLNNLREGAGEFSRGNLDYRLPVQGTDEIALIAGQMNDMADSLKRSLAVLEAKLSESTNALAVAKGKEISIRHEINNPLTNVIGNVELLMERYEHKDKDLTARLEVILNSSLRIAETTKRLRDIKRENAADRRTDIKTQD